MLSLFVKNSKALLKNTFIYHCGPVVKKTEAGYSFLSSGPTTSIREEPYQSDVIRDYGLIGVIGKWRYGG